jgi:hypothetical protein
MMSFIMNPLRRLLLLILLALCALPARAADVVYPVGSQVGLVPPPGMETSASFYGFEDRTNEVALVIATFPADAYAEFEKTITADALKKQNFILETREGAVVPFGKGFLLVGRQQIENKRVRKWMLFAAFPALTALVTVQVPEAAKAQYPDARIRESLRTVAVRPTVPVEEQLALLPFKVGDIAGFGVAGIVPGRAVILSDAKPGTPVPGAEPHILITLGASGPVQTADRDQFARDVFLAVPNLKGARITGSESLRFGGQQGHQIFASAQEPASGAELTVVQWLRFGGAGFMQLLGVSRADAWRDAYPRFRAVRDGIDAR